MSGFEEEYGLVFPFVTCKSNGGPHDDESYAAGYEMGSLNMLLGNSQPHTHSQSIHTSNKAQADLIAMNHGYSIELTPTIHEEWTWLTVWKSSIED